MPFGIEKKCIDALGLMDSMGSFIKNIGRYLKMMFVGLLQISSP